MVLDDEVGRPAAVGDYIAARTRLSDPDPTLQWLGALLRSEGVDLLDAREAELERGTPVYVSAKADIVPVQRLMARHHIRSVAVVDGGRLVGIVDLVDLANEVLPAPPDQG